MKNLVYVYDDEDYDFYKYDCLPEVLTHDDLESEFREEYNYTLLKEDNETKTEKDRAYFRGYKNGLEMLARVLISRDMDNEKDRVRAKETVKNWEKKEIEKVKKLLARCEEFNAQLKSDGRASLDFLFEPNEYDYDLHNCLPKGLTQRELEDKFREEYSFTLIEESDKAKSERDRIYFHGYKNGLEMLARKLIYRDIDNRFCAWHEDWVNAKETVKDWEKGESRKVKRLLARREKFDF